ncbi:MAG: hypothetical protein L6R41_006894 [Letrouitia leprolyta]|nr:MAG: hypothetical protein L6R41_006894 [Letrouitia leprolyta]
MARRYAGSVSRDLYLEDALDPSYVAPQRDANAEYLAELSMSSADPDTREFEALIRNEPERRKWFANQLERGKRQLAVREDEIEMNKETFDEFFATTAALRQSIEQWKVKEEDMENATLAENVRQIIRMLELKPSLAALIVKDANIQNIINERINHLEDRLENVVLHIDELDIAWGEKVMAKVDAWELPQKLDQQVKKFQELLSASQRQVEEITAERDRAVDENDQLQDLRENLKLREETILRQEGEIVQRKTALAAERQGVANDKEILAQDQKDLHKEGIRLARAYGGVREKNDRLKIEEQDIRVRHDAVIRGEQQLDDDRKALDRREAEVKMREDRLKAREEYLNESEGQAVTSRMDRFSAELEKVSKAVMNLSVRRDVSPGAVQTPASVRPRGSLPSLLGHGKRGSDVSIADNETAPKRRMSARSGGGQGDSPGSGQTSPSAAVITATGGVQSGSTVPTGKVRMFTGQQSGGVPVAGFATPIGASVLAIRSPITLALPSNTPTPHPDVSAVWKQIDFSADFWSQEDLILLVKHLEEIRKRPDGRYRFPKAFDHCATKRHELCLLTYCRGWKRPTYLTTDEACGNCTNSLCLRITLTTPDPGPYDPDSTTKRWRLTKRQHPE